MATTNAPKIKPAGSTPKPQTAAEKAQAAIDADLAGDDTVVADEGKNGADTSAAARAKAKKDGSAATPSPPKKDKTPVGIVYFIGEDGSMGKEGEAKGDYPKEVLENYINTLDDEEKDEVVTQIYYAVQVEGQFEAFEISEHRSFVLTSVDPSAAES